MQQMPGYFDKFRQAIEPDDKHKKHAQKADDPVREYLASHDLFAEHHETTFLYGSYRRRTAEGDIKDVDLVVITNFTTDDDPIDVLNQLKDSLAELYEEPQLAEQRRSIRVDRPLPDVPNVKLTLDIIPAIYQDVYDPEGPLWVPDRDKKCWIPSHPKGHIAYAERLSKQSKLDHGFVRLAKMMKWWWKYQFEQRKSSVASHERKPKGFWIEVMTGEYTDLTKDSYPELIVALLENVFGDFKSFRLSHIMPSLPDPGLRNYPDPTHRTIKTSMTVSEFAFFLDVMEESLGWAREALNTSSERVASEYWRKFFGAKFPLAADDRATGGLLSSAITPGGLTFPDRPVVPHKPGGFA